MVEAQAGMRYYSEYEPCLTTFNSFYLCAFQPPRHVAVVLLVTPRHLGEILGVIQI
jgi:hypothetical protein